MIIKILIPSEIWLKLAMMKQQWWWLCIEEFHLKYDWYGWTRCDEIPFIPGFAVHPPYQPNRHHIMIIVIFVKIIHLREAII